MLLAVIFLLFLLALSLMIAAPRMARQIQRDHEVETMHRGKQYIRAIQLYYHKFHAYPPSVDALVNTNAIRFLRKRYLDPITGKDDWKPVMFGQNKAPTAMGFFGQPLAGSTISGIGPSGGGSGVPGLPGSSPLTGGALGSIFNAGSTATGTSSSGGTDTSGSTGVSGSTGATGTGSVGAAGGGATGTTGTTSAFGATSGKTFGGAGIIGVSPNSPKTSILIYKTKSKYNEWEFVYDPITEQAIRTGGSTGPSSGIDKPSSTNPAPTMPPETSAPQ